MERLSAEVLRLHKGVSFAGITTCFFCHDGQGNFILAKRSQRSRDEHGRWEVGGGGLKFGVTVKDNIKRELKEEFNVAPKKLEFLGYRDIFRKLNDGTPTHWVALDFAVLVDPKQVKNNEPEMFDEVAWFTLGTLPAPLHSQAPTFFKQYKNDLKRILKT